MAMKRNINAVDWIKRATAAQVQKMREALAELPGSEREEVDRARNKQIDNVILCNIPRAYALVPGPSDNGVPSWHLLTFRVEDGLVVELNKSVQNVRGVHLQAIEDDILRDA